MKTSHFDDVISVA